MRSNKESNDEPDKFQSPSKKITATVKPSEVDLASNSKKESSQSGLSKLTKLTSKLSAFQQVKKDLVMQINSINEWRKSLDSTIQRVLKSYEDDWKSLNPIVKKLVTMAGEVTINGDTINSKSLDKERLLR